MDVKAEVAQGVPVVPWISGPMPGQLPQKGQREDGALTILLQHQPEELASYTESTCLWAGSVSVLPLYNREIQDATRHPLRPEDLCSLVMVCTPVFTPCLLL